MEIPPEVAAAITGIQDIRTTQYLGTAALTLWAWDLVINFDNEVKYVWSRNLFQLGQILYLLNRYFSGAILAMGVGFLLSPPKAPKFCGVSVWVVLFTGMGTVLLVQTVLMVRVCAIWGQSNWIRAIVAAGCMAEIISIFAFGVPFLRSLTFVPLDIPSIGIHACVSTTDLPITRYRFWIIPLLFDVLLFILVVVRGWNDLLKRSNNPGSMILRVIVRDSTMIFLYNLLAQSAYIFLWRFGRSSLTETPSEMGNAIDIIFATRMLINLWSRFYASDHTTLQESNAIGYSQEVFALRTIGGGTGRRKLQTRDTFWEMQEEEDDLTVADYR